MRSRRSAICRNAPCARALRKRVNIWRWWCNPTPRINWPWHRTLRLAGVSEKSEGLAPAQRRAGARKEPNMASKIQRTPSAATLTREQEYALLQAVEQGDEHTVMVDWLKRYPDLTDEIIAFVSALRIFDTQDDEAIYATANAVDIGIARGLARVTAVAAAPALDLKAALEA